MNYPFSLKELYEFIINPGNAYASGGKYEKKPERPGFYELVSQEGNWHYRDSYTGFYRSRGMEVVRFAGKPIWSSLYGGGMVKGKEKLAKKTFGFLRQAMLRKDTSFQSFRGPKNLKNGDWEYRYNQEGGVEEFNGYEEILYQGNVVFFHRIIGGTIINR